MIRLIFALFLTFLLVSLEAAENDYVFNPLAVKRDPFLPPSDLGKNQLSNLQRFDLGEIKIVAVMTGLGAPKAMVLLPDGSTHVVQAGDKVGRHGGSVNKITGSELVVEEIFKDHRGRQKRSFTSLVLAE